jgi:hypothetical protein
MASEMNHGRRRAHERAYNPDRKADSVTMAERKYSFRIMKGHFRLKKMKNGRSPWYDYNELYQVRKHGGIKCLQLSLRQASLIRLLLFSKSYENPTAFSRIAFTYDSLMPACAQEGGDTSHLAFLLGAGENLHTGNMKVKKSLCTKLTNTS